MRRPLPFVFALPLNCALLLAATIALTALSAPKSENERVALATAMASADVFGEIGTH
jgi:hypothetical protein